MIRKAVIVLSLFITGISYAQILPDHTLKDFDLQWKVKQINEAGYDYVNGVLKQFQQKEISFNRKGLLTSYQEVNNNNIDANSQYLCYYNAEDNMSKLVDNSRISGNITQVFTYNTVHTITDIEEIYNHPTYGYNITMKVVPNANNLPAIKEEYKGDKLQRYSVYIYSNGKLTEVETKLAGEIFVSNQKYTYDEKGNLIKDVLTTDTSTSVINYEYNAEGQLMLIKVGDFITKVEYLEPDERGNWTKKRLTATFAYDDTPLITVIYRQITYYDGVVTGDTYPHLLDTKYNYSRMDFSKTSLTKNGVEYAISIADFDGKFSLRSHYFGATPDLLICEQNSGAVFLVKNYKTAEDGAILTPEFLGRHKAYYTVGDSGHWLYYEGEYIQESKNTWLGNHLYVYSPRFKKAFLLMNYKTRVPGGVYEAKDVTTASGACFYKMEEGYKLIYNGEQVQGKPATDVIDNHLYVYDSLTKQSFILRDFKLKPVGNEYPVFNADFVAQSEEPQCFKIDLAGGFYVVQQGKLLSEPTTSVYQDDDLIITLTDGRKYIVYDYLTLNPQEFKQAVKVLRKP